MTLAALILGFLAGFGTARYAVRRGVTPVHDVPAWLRGKETWHEAYMDSLADEYDVTRYPSLRSKFTNLSPLTPLDKRRLSDFRERIRLEPV